MFCGKVMDNDVTFPLNRLKCCPLKSVSVEGGQLVPCCNSKLRLVLGHLPQSRKHPTYLQRWFVVENTSGNNVTVH